MKEAFTQNIAGTHKHPHTAMDFQRCIQLKEESSLAFKSRWVTMKNGSESVYDETAMFKKSLILTYRPALKWRLVAYRAINRFYLSPIYQLNFL
jgi:hypothetical protein